MCFYWWRVRSVIRHAAHSRLPRVQYTPYAVVINSSILQTLLNHLAALACHNTGWFCQGRVRMEEDWQWDYSFISQGRSPSCLLLNSGTNDIIWSDRDTGGIKLIQSIHFNVHCILFMSDVRRSQLCQLNPICPYVSQYVSDDLNAYTDWQVRTQIDRFSGQPST